MNKVTENRRKGDQNSELSLLAEVFKPLGNSAYGKMIEGLERQTTVKYTKKREHFNERFTVGVVSGLGRNRRRL